MTADEIRNKACTSLRQLYHAGWTNGDVRPEDFCVSEDSAVRIIDFARSKQVWDQSAPPESEEIEEVGHWFEE
ncbi:hypothetical protein M427DRAFT_61980 [Gonapodya prolifera JEL478]|uniref:Protein kinase domain-containing protein n=1 Tax=Gonapodya prolifera (strain JEL478) TaxID=1344416 RepID=A0A139A0Z1_GONPJ|nr:hypothetical protein M427DRAFT_61980 [Gonapodya prolifera JEL478]|eukprot:KXS10447.1 hypothetical protein M427DRAFT_61980 [Gonapodya prolifera JEL478]